MNYGVCIFLAVVLSGCALSRGVIRTKAVDVVGVPDAGTPAKLATGEAKRSFAIPAGATVEITRTAATDSTPAVESAQFSFPAPSEYQETSTRVDASTGTVDTTIRKHQIDVAESRIWLYASLVAFVAAIGCAVMKWPGPALLCAAAGAAFFCIWKISGLPSWFVAVPVGAIIGGACLMFGYKRAEWDRNRDGIPDIFQPKT